MSSVVFVTGASSGIGEATCRQLIAGGYRVVGAARNEDKLQALARELGADFHAQRLDVNDAAAVAALPDSLPRELREIGVLINNAGHDTGGRRSFEQGSAEQWCEIVETNVQGLIRVTRALIDGMLVRGQGHIVNLGSIMGIKPCATLTAYVASKYAVHGLSETLRLDYAGKGIRVTEIMPGLVHTGFAAQRFGDAEKAEEYYASSGPSLAADDVANTVMFALQQPKHVEIAQLVVLPVS